MNHSLLSYSMLYLLSWATHYRKFYSLFPYLLFLHLTNSFHTSNLNCSTNSNSILENMAGRDIETLLSYHCLTGKHLNKYSFNIIIFLMQFIHNRNFNFHSLIGPLVKNPVLDIDKAINKLRLKYRTYIVEYDFDSVSMLSFPYNI